MEMIIDLKNQNQLNNLNNTNGINNINLIDLNKLGMELTKDKGVKEFKSIVEKTLSSAADYVIKSLPLNEGVKNTIIDIKNSFLKNDLKKVVNTTVNSSIKEGLENFGFNSREINSVIKIKDIALKGGLRESIVGGIDIVSKKYIKNNLMSEIVSNFFDKLKDFVSNNAFLKKMEQRISKLIKKKNEFLDTCKKWYKYYDSFDFQNAKSLARSINIDSKTVSFDKECLRENKIIQNMINIIQNSDKKLSDFQLQLCRTL